MFRFFVGNYSGNSDFRFLFFLFNHGQVSIFFHDLVDEQAAFLCTVGICYGPHALSNARKIRSFLYVDGPGFSRAILRNDGLYPVPDPPEPMLLHEPEGSLWRQRADLTVSLRAEEKETHPTRRGAVTVPPAVTIHSGR